MNKLLRKQYDLLFDAQKQFYRASTDRSQRRLCMSVGLEKLNRALGIAETLVDLYESDSKTEHLENKRKEVQNE